MKQLFSLSIGMRTLCIWVILSVTASVRSMPHQQLDISDIYHPPPVWSNDGRFVAMADRSDVVIWNAELHEMAMTLSGHTNAVTAITWGPNDETIVTGSRDKTAKVWTVADGTLLHDLRGHEELVTAVEWFPDGQRILTMQADGNPLAFVWDAFSGQLLARHQSGGTAASGIAFSPDGSHFAHVSAGVYIQNADTFERIARFGVVANDLKEVVAWSPDGQHLVTGGSNGAIYVWDVGSGEIVQQFAGSPRYTRNAFQRRVDDLAFTWIRDVAFNADGQQVFSAAADGTVQAWDWETGELVAFTTLDPLGAAAWNEADGRLAYLPPIDEATRDDEAVPVIVSPFE